ncbi:helix-turn-helix domain-containing protein [Novipirellula herctigrandis]
MRDSNDLWSINIVQTAIVAYRFKWHGYVQYSHMIDAEKRLKLSYLYGGEVLYQPGEALKTRLLTDYEFVYLINGDISYGVGNETYLVPAGGMILGRPGCMEKYRWDTTQRTRHAYCHFAIQEIPNDWPAPKDWPFVSEAPDQLAVSLFLHIMRRIYDHSDWPATAPGKRDCLLVETLIDTFLKPHDEEYRSFERDRPEPVRRALKWLRQRIDDDPRQEFSLADIAKAAGCTPKHLCRVFATSVGYSPAQTGSLLRLQLATTLLTRSNLSVKEIANKCGFADPLYFSRRYKETFGRPPSAVRSDLAKGIPPPAAPLPIDITPRVRW